MLISVILVLQVAVFYATVNETHSKLIKSSLKSFYNDTELIQCAEKDVINCSKEIISWSGDFYNYSRRGDYLKKVDDLKSSGGDCFDYSSLYSAAAMKNGLDTKLIQFCGDDQCHMMSLVYDRNLTAYCLLDSIGVSCAEFLKEEDEYVTLH